MVYDLINCYLKLVPSYLYYGTNGLEFNAVREWVGAPGTDRLLLRGEPIAERVQASTITNVRTTRFKPLNRRYLLRRFPRNHYIFLFGM
jgi:hypothetical protein